MTCSAWRTDRLCGYDHRRTGPCVHQRERAAVVRKRTASAPDPPIYPMAQIHRHACLQVHLSSTPGCAPTGAPPDEQQWNQTIGRGWMSTWARRQSTIYRSKKPDLKPKSGDETRRAHAHCNAFVYSNVSERDSPHVRYQPVSGYWRPPGAKLMAPHTPMPPRHNWRTMHP
jgi:hypothetical protein